ncbi:UDP-glucose 6-dehydrogenase TuaD [compost metagenome]
MANVKGLLGDKIHYVEDQYEALTNADALLIATEWSVFRNPDFEKMEQVLTNKVIFDGRNLYDLEKMIDLGYYYNSVGRKLID